jgi:hypothetical protein
MKNDWEINDIACMAVSIIVAIAVFVTIVVLALVFIRNPAQGLAWLIAGGLVISAVGILLSFIID